MQIPQQSFAQRRDISLIARWAQGVQACLGALRRCVPHPFSVGIDVTFLVKVGKFLGQGLKIGAGKIVRAAERLAILGRAMVQEISALQLQRFITPAIATGTVAVVAAIGLCYVVCQASLAARQPEGYSIKDEFHMHRPNPRLPLGLAVVGMGLFGGTLLAMGRKALSLCRRRRNRTLYAHYTPPTWRT
jgi:hypothetical protein